MTDELSETLREITERIDALGMAYMLVGSVAALVYGRSRSTQDFDMVIDASAKALRDLVRSLSEDRFYASEAAALEALRHQTLFNVIDMDTGWKVDLIPKKPRTKLSATASLAIDERSDQPHPRACRGILGRMSPWRVRPSEPRAIGGWARWGTMMGLCVFASKKGECRASPRTSHHIKSGK